MAASEQEYYDMAYLARVIGQGMSAGAPPLVIAERLVKTDLVGMGFSRSGTPLIHRHGMNPADIEKLYGVDWRIGIG